MRKFPFFLFSFLSLTSDSSLVARTQSLHNHTRLIKLFFHFFLLYIFKMRFSVLIAAAASFVLASAGDCPAAGTTDAQGRYSCNPAHQYPNGQTCNAINGCYFLSNGTMPQPTCANPGEYDAMGHYSCNPAHQYPDGQQCNVVNGCPILCDKNGKPIMKGTSTPTPPPKVCPAPGTCDGKGRYGCNPAHQYPAGQSCVLIDGCYLLCQNGTPITTTVVPPPQPTKTTAPVPPPNPPPVVTGAANAVNAAPALLVAGIAALL